MFEEDLKQLIIKTKEKIYSEAGPVLEVSSYQQGYWTGYLAALDDLLAELNKPPVVLCKDCCEYSGMGFD